MKGVSTIKRSGVIKEKVKALYRMVYKTVLKEVEAAAIGNKISTIDLVDRIYNFCEVYSGRVLYKYQTQFAKRVIRSVLDNDGAEITALFARQSGKSETIAVVTGGLMILLPILANMPMFADDRRFMMYKDGVWIGVFAPSQRQAQITYNRMKTRLQSPQALAILNDPEFNLFFSTSNGQTVRLSNGSFATAISASDGSNIEGESFKIIICEESQDISNYKLTKCLTGDTQVLLSSGEYKSLKEVVEDKKDELVVFDEDMQYLSKAVPYEFYDNGVKDVYEITLMNGEKIKATENHQFYTYNQKTHGDKCAFRTVQQIIDSLGNDRPLRIGVPDRLPYFAKEEPNDYERGLVVGYFLGDGCMRGTPQFIGDILTCERLLEAIHIAISPDVKMSVHNYNHNNGMQEVAFCTPTNKKNSNPLKKFFRDFGIDELKGVEKYLPDKLYSRDFYLGLISGLIETDGCVTKSTYKPEIVFSNTSEKLVRQLQSIYLKFGIHSRLSFRDNSGILPSRGNPEKVYTSKYPLFNVVIKSVEDIKRFYSEVSLYMKQVYLEEAYRTVQSKSSHRKSKYYPNSMRFIGVHSIECVGKEHTYCVGVRGRNFIANDMISSNSISPMGAAYNATTIKIGTATIYKGNFYEAIQRNKKEYQEGKLRVKNHFEYDYHVVQKYNPNYAKYIEREKKTLGENSDAFRMSYGLEWIFSRGMFIDINEFEIKCGNALMDFVERDLTTTHVVGIDVGGGGDRKTGDIDSTVLSVVEVDWNSPAIVETSYNEETGQDETYIAYDTRLVYFKKFTSPDYEEQYHEILEIFKNFKISKLVMDTTKESSMCQRIRANVRFPVEGFVFSSKSKSDLYKHFESEIETGRFNYPNSATAKECVEHKEFIHQMTDLQKSYRGSYLVVSHPPEKGAHDDYPDSVALALWAAKTPATPDETETADFNNVFGNKSFNSVRQNFYSPQQRMNRLTAMRRR